MSDDKKMRLQKFLSACGVASRRGAEALIAAGKIAIDGVVVTEQGVRVTGEESITCDGKAVTLSVKRYLILNKPEGYLCTRKDELGRPTVFDLLGRDDDPSLFYVGRLDRDSSGLLILTNDGDFANQLIHPSHCVVKKYRVTSDGVIAGRLAKSFIAGVEVDGVRYKALSCEIGAAGNVAFVELQEGKKREIRMVFAHFSQKIIALERVCIGKMRLDHLGIAPGKYLSVDYFTLKKYIYG